ncbi:MAG: 2-hydroxychromene-2-carboxylate isomerase [Rhodospirillales bacterium]|nr:2-hydroxychromene-2-carboxylate isomerase [Rhodospirillales bacterium]
MRALEFWFEFASTYSYLAAMRVEDLARAAGVPVVWRPFLLGPIFAKQGWTGSPFTLYPAKGRYMWRDMERLCKAEGLPFRRPSEFPRNGLLAARIATAADGQEWLPEFVRRVFRANFVDDQDIADRQLLAALSSEEWLARAEAAETKDRLRERTLEAERRGIFGAPSFLVGDELFWGNDRLAQALAWARES